MSAWVPGAPARKASEATVDSIKATQCSGNSADGSLLPAAGGVRWPQGRGGLESRSEYLTTGGDSVGGQGQGHCQVGSVAVSPQLYACPTWGLASPSPHPLEGLLSPPCTFDRRRRCQVRGAGTWHPSSSPHPLTPSPFVKHTQDETPTRGLTAAQLVTTRGGEHRTPSEGEGASHVLE